MRKRQVWRYYCDFCSKGRCTAKSIADHEPYCTKNPERKCRMCILWGESKQEPIPVLKAALDISLDELLKVAHNCPACVLAAIRQSDATSDQYEWSYSEACERFWRELKVEQENEAQQQVLSEMYGL